MPSRNPDGHGEHRLRNRTGLNRPGPEKQRTSPSVAEVLHSICRHPFEYLVRRWNWKAALLGSLVRTPLFFFADLPAGRKAAVAALLTDLILRPLTAGCYGAITEALGGAEPAWAASLAALVLLPVANHTLEFVVHWMRGTPRLAYSLVASVSLTVISTLFNLYVMRRGAFIVGENRRSLLDDLRRTPRLVIGFLAAGPMALLRWCKFRAQRAVPPRPEPGWESEAG